MGLRILGWGSALPEKVVTNDDAHHQAWTAMRDY